MFVCMCVKCCFHITQKTNLLSVLLFVLDKFVFVAFVVHYSSITHNHFIWKSVQWVSYDACMRFHCTIPRMKKHPLNIYTVYVPDNSGMRWKCSTDEFNLNVCQFCSFLLVVFICKEIRSYVEYRKEGTSVAF